MPKRIQSFANSVLPPNCVFVGPGSKWENHSEVVENPDGTWCVKYGAVTFSHKSREEAEACAVRLYIKYLANDGSQAGQIRDSGGAALVDAAPDELRGMDLACTCELGHECHADVLLEIASWGERLDDLREILDDLFS